jgi:NADPH:quinone reductase-like Zn-dependent oxidoreductase
LFLFSENLDERNIMKAFIVDRYGRKDGVRFGEMPEPELRADDVLVQIQAAGVNLLDSKIRDGEQAHFALSLAAHFRQ